MDFISPFQFLVSVGGSMVVGGTFLKVYYWLSAKPMYEKLYFPGRILRDKPPWKGYPHPRKPSDWIREAYTASEAEVLDAGGVDAAAYLIFLGSVLQIVVCMGFILVAVLIFDYNAQAIYDALKLMEGRMDVGDLKLVAYMVFSYLISFQSYYFLWKGSKKISRLPISVRETSRPRPEQYTILLRDFTCSTGIDSLKNRIDQRFRALFPAAYYKSIVISNTKEANKIYKNLQTYKHEVDIAQAMLAGSINESNPDGIRPTMRTGLFGLIGKRTDKIDYYTKKIQEILPKLYAEQRVCVRQKLLPAALVIFNDVNVAALASRASKFRMEGDTMAVIEAPEPCQLIWDNLPLNPMERLTRRLAIYCAVAYMTVAFWLLPRVTHRLIVPNFRRLGPLLKKIQPGFQTVLLVILPELLSFLSKKEGIVSKSQITRAVSTKHFFFVLLNFFLGLGSQKVVLLFGQKLQIAFTFFVTYVGFKVFISFAMELARVCALFKFHWKMYRSNTEDEEKEAWAPGELSYASRVPEDMVIVMIVYWYVSLFSIWAIPAGVLYFGLGWLVTRNQVLNVYVPSNESNGKIWPHIHDRVLAAVFINQVMTFMFVLAHNFRYTLFMLPLGITMIVYVCYSDDFSRTPVDITLRELGEVPNVEAIYRAYIPDCLRPVNPDDIDYFDESQPQFCGTLA